MPRSKEPFVIQQRSDSKTFLLTLNATCGLPQRVCDEWQRRSFQNFPAELADYRNPKDKKAAKPAAYVLIQYLKKKQEEGSIRRLSVEDITVGAWIKNSWNLKPAQGQELTPRKTDLSLMTRWTATRARILIIFSMIS